MSVAAPQPQPPPPGGSSQPQLPPRWAFAAGAAVLGAAALRTLWLWYAGRTSNDLVPGPAVEDQAAAAPMGQAAAEPLGGAAAVDVARAAVQLAVAEAGAQLAAAKGAEAVAAAQEAVGELPPSPTASPEAAAAAAAAAAASAAADAAAEAVGPVVLAAETGGAVNETATMTLEQLQGMATELYIVIQQVGSCLGPVAGVLRRPANA